MKNFLSVVLLIIITNLNPIEAMNINITEMIIPQPQRVEVRKGVFRIKETVDIFFPNDIEHDIIFKELEESLKLIGCLAATKSANAEKAQVVFKISNLAENELFPAGKANESYHISIAAEKILIESYSRRGLFYGAMSLIQLIERSSGKLPHCDIYDWPDLGIRGISDDISRGQVSNIENFKRILRFISRYKMNTYMPYLEDMLVFDSYPSIGKNRGALTREEVSEILEYAEQYYVEIIPIFQTLGHYENILSMSEFIQYAEFPGAASLCVSDEAVYEFLEDMLKEVFELFPSKYFHMGADESYDVGLGKSKFLVEQSSIADVHAMHYKRVYDICKKYGKEVLMYGDIILRHPEILEKLPKDITIVDWHYRADFEYNSTEVFAEAGFNYIVSPSVWNFRTSYPTYVNAVPNIKYITGQGIKNGSIGMINSNWGDYGAETIKELILPGYAWSAQCAWSYNKSSIDNFYNSFFSDFFLTDDNSAQLIHEIFSNSLNQTQWHEVWRHPLLPFRPTDWWEPRVSPSGKYEWMTSTSNITSQIVEDLKKSAGRNRDFVDILKYIYNQNKWYAEKIKIQNVLHTMLKERVINESAVEQINIALKKLVELKSDYKNMWNKYYKSANLNMIEDKFDRLKSYFEEVKSDLQNDSLKSPELESDWIYCPKDSSEYFSRSEFIKEFELDGSPKEAKLQFLGDTYVKLYINDKYIDEVYVRRSLSLWTEYKRIKYLDVTDYLQEGENSIKVVAESFNRAPFAGFNLTSRIATNEDTLFIKSDESWMARPVDSGEDWSRAKKKDYRFTIVSPNFNTDRASWIER